MKKKNAKNTSKFEKFQHNKISKQTAKKVKGGIVVEDVVLM